VRRPPQRCAAQPPGTCASGDGLQTRRSMEMRQSPSARKPMLAYVSTVPGGIEISIVHRQPLRGDSGAATFTPGSLPHHHAASDAMCNLHGTNTAWMPPRLPQGEAECKGAWRACDTAYPQKKADSTVPLTASDTPACLAIAVKAIEKPTRSTYAVNVARKHASTMRWRAWAATCQKRVVRWTTAAGERRPVAHNTNLCSGEQRRGALMQLH